MRDVLSLARAAARAEAAGLIVATEDGQEILATDGEIAQAQVRSAETSFAFTAIDLAWAASPGGGYVLTVPLPDASGAIVLTTDRARRLTSFRTDTLRALASQAQARLELEREAERRRLLSRVVLETQSAVVFTDVAGRVRWTNEAYERMTGYPLAEMVGRKPGLILQGPLTDPDVARLIAACVRARTHCETEILNYRKDGTPYWARMAIAPMFSPEGEHEGFFSIQTDVTERRLELAFSEAESRTLRLLADGAGLHEVLESVAELVEAQDPELVCSILSLDETGRMWFQAAPQLSRDFIEAVDGFSMGCGVGSCGTAAAEGRIVIVADLETHPYWEGIRHFPLSAGLRACWSVPIFATDGSVVGTFGTYHRRPVAPTVRHLELMQTAAHLAALAMERRRGERRLAESEAFLRSVVESSHDCIKVLGLDGRLLWLNDKGRSLLECGSDPAPIGCDWFAFWSGPTQVEARDAVAAAAAGEVGKFRGFCRTFAGTPKWWDVAITPIDDGDGVVSRVLAVSRDVTATVDAERELLRRLSVAAEYRDDATAAHNQRIGEAARMVGLRLGLDEARCELLRHAATLHDVGKIGVPDAILRKPGALDPEERRQMERHVEIGAQILESADDSLLRMARDIAMTHHERWDGSGYPHGLAGTEIPIEGRIVAVCDVFDALVNERSYKPAWPHETAVAEIARLSGSHFDPAVVGAFLDCLTLAGCCGQSCDRQAVSV